MRDVAEMHVVTSALSLARELFRYGEPELAEKALRLRADEVASVGSRIGQIEMSGQAAQIWPDGPANRAYLLGVIERLEGQPRPAARTRRLPEKSLPQHMQATEEQRWQAAAEVSKEMDGRLRHRR